MIAMSVLMALKSSAGGRTLTRNDLEYKTPLERHEHPTAQALASAREQCQLRLRSERSVPSPCSARGESAAGAGRSPLRVPSLLSVSAAPRRGASAAALPGPGGCARPLLQGHPPAGRAGTRNPQPGPMLEPLWFSLFFVWYKLLNHVPTGNLWLGVGPGVPRARPRKERGPWQFRGKAEARTPKDTPPDSQTPAAHHPRRGPAPGPPPRTPAPCCSQASAEPPAHRRQPREHARGGGGHSWQGRRLRTCPVRGSAPGSGPTGERRPRPSRSRPAPPVGAARRAVRPL